jgi:hypothetical protein
MQANIVEGKMLRSEEILKRIEDKTLIQSCLQTNTEDISEGSSEFQFEKEPFFLEDQFKVDPEGGLEFINKQTISIQRSILPQLLKNLGTAIIKGKPIATMPMPIEVNADFSILERFANTLTYAPQMLEKGNETNDSFEQFSIAIAQWIASFHLSAFQETPIEPIVGETFQGKIGGIPVYIEQVLPLEAGNAFSFLLPGKNFTLSGTWWLVATVYPNSCKGHLQGPSVTHFKNNGTKVYFQHPPASVSGLGLGKRKIDYGGKFYAWDFENKLFAELEANPPSGGLLKKKTTTTDYITGTIWTAKDSFFQKIKDSISKKKLIDFKFNPKEDFVEEKARIDGSWIGTFKIGDKIYWKFGAIKPHKLVHCNQVLPSDSNVRKDIILKRLGNNKAAEQVKEELKNIEDRDIKLRKVGRKGGSL